jgi:hypothetical protein
MHGRISLIALGHPKRLAATLIRKTGTAGVGHPNLQGAKPRHPKRVTVLLNPCIDACSCHFKTSIDRCMKHSMEELRLMQRLMDMESKDIGKGP